VAVAAQILLVGRGRARQDRPRSGHLRHPCRSGHSFVGAPGYVDLTSSPTRRPCR